MVIERGDSFVEFKFDLVSLENKDSVCNIELVGIVGILVSIGICWIYNFVMFFFFNKYIFFIMIVEFYFLLVNIFFLVNV